SPQQYTWYVVSTAHALRTPSVTPPMLVMPGTAVGTRLVPLVRPSPSAPFVASPQQYTVCIGSATAHVDDVPTAMSVTLVMPATSVGTPRSVVVPSPS